MPAFKNEKRVFNFWLQWNVSLNLQMSTMISMFRHIERADWPSSASSIFRVFCSSSIVYALFKHCSNIYLGIVQVLLNYCSGFFKYFSIIAQVHFSNIVPSTMLSTLFGRPVCFKYSKPESVIDPCCPSHLDPCRLNTGFFFGKLLFLTLFEQKHIFFSGCNCHFAIF